MIVYSDSPLWREAIDSVAKQTISKGDMEVVIATSFSQDFQIPRELEKETQVKVVESKELTSGGKIRDGARVCKGDVVAFLDYDDMWESDRLSAVNGAFKNTDGLGYFHNNFSFILGNQAPERGMYRSVVNGLLSTGSDSRFIDPASSSPGEMIRWMGSGTFNMSSIAVKRSVLLDFLAGIPNVNLSIEDIIFFNCLNLNKKGMQDSRKLTRVRMHHANVSNASNRLKNIEAEKVAIRSLLALMNETSNNTIGACLDSYVQEKELYSSMSIEFTGRTEVMRQLLSYLSTYHTSGILPKPILSSMAASYLISPSIYTRLLNKRFTQR